MTIAPALNDVLSWDEFPHIKGVAERSIFSHLKRKGISVSHLPEPTISVSLGESAAPIIFGYEGPLPSLVPVLDIRFEWLIDGESYYARMKKHLHDKADAMRFAGWGGFLE